MMKRISRRRFLAGALATAAAGCNRVLPQAVAEGFVCPPCGCAADDLTFDAPGICPACGMTLMPAGEHDLGFAPTQLAPGAGHFTLPGGVGRESDHIDVHYFWPAVPAAQMPVLIVLPGSGRDSASYRNGWMEIANRHSVLIAALGYPERRYGFADYHLGGVVEDFRFGEFETVQTGPQARVVRLRDEDLELQFVANPERWLFGDFERVFDLLRRASGSESMRYDLFGHSAGAQLLHRSVLFQPASRAHRIVAANAGFYTLPDREQSLPVGLAGTGVDDAALAAAFSKQLMVLVGERDDDDAAGGTLLHTPVIDAQGRGRRSRGQTFHATAQREARRIGTPLRWTIDVVPGVGHDFRGMSAAAAGMLYP